MVTRNSNFSNQIKRIWEATSRRKWKWASDISQTWGEL